VSSTLGRSQPRPVDLLSPMLQTIPEATGKNAATARARTRSRIMAVLKAEMSTRTAPAANLTVVALGYADGIPREISPDASIEIHRRRHAVVGGASMDQSFTDVGADYVRLGRTATVFGPRDGVTPSIRAWTRWGGTIPR
jgi:hypothetical protein